MILANGTTCFFAFMSLRHNDNHLVAMTGLEASWQAAVRKYYNSDLYKMYGDSIFRQSLWMGRPHRGAATGSPHQERNANMAPVRIPAEWHFGNQAGKVKLVGKLGRNQVLSQPVETFLAVANFVHNCFVCLHGSQTETYFAVPGPSLEQYCGVASRHDQPAAPDDPGPSESDDPGSGSEESAGSDLEI